MRDELYAILTAPRDTDQEIRDLTDRMYELMWSTVPGAIRYDVPRVQTSPQDRMASVSAEVDEMQRKLVELCRRKRREEDTIRELIRRCVDLDVKERQVLRGRYLHRQSWEQIAAELASTDRWAYAIHKSAADKLEAFLGLWGNKM